MIRFNILISLNSASLLKEAGVAMVLIVAMVTYLVQGDPQVSVRIFIKGIQVISKSAAKEHWVLKRRKSALKKTTLQDKTR